MPTICVEAIGDGETLPAEPFAGSLNGKHEAVDWALCWLPEGGEPSPKATST